MADPFTIIASILSAASAANSLANPPSSPNQPGQAPIGTQNASAGLNNNFSLPSPGPMAGAQQLGSLMSRSTTTPLQAPPAREPKDPPKPPPEEKPKETSVGDVLAQVPQALATIQSLFGDQGGPGKRPAPAPGGTAGQVVQGFQLPQRDTIGQLLAAIPRFR